MDVVGTNYGCGICGGVHGGARARRLRCRTLLVARTADTIVSKTRNLNIGSVWADVKDILEVRRRAMALPV